MLIPRNITWFCKKKNFITLRTSIMTSVEEDQRAHLVEAQKSFIKLRISNQIWRRGLIMQPSCKIFWSSVCNSWEACLWFTKNPCPEQSKNSSLSLKRSCSIKFQRSISNNTNKEMWVQVRGEVEKVYLPPLWIKSVRLWSGHGPNLQPEMRQKPFIL